MSIKNVKYNSLAPDEYGAHKKIIESVEPNKTVLEIGCASGYISKKLIEKGCFVWGVEIDPISAEKASKYCTNMIVGDIEDPTILKKLKRSKFETIILADVLEHLKDPEKVLVSLVKFLSKDGIILISLPNIAFLTNRLNHLLGRFDYTDYGIMDKTHLRFFTKRTLFSMINKCGLRIVKKDYVGNFTQLPFFMQTLYPIFRGKRLWREWEYKITGFWQEGLAVQFLIVCQKNAKT